MGKLTAEELATWKASIAECESMYNDGGLPHPKDVLMLRMGLDHINALEAELAAMGERMRHEGGSHRMTLELVGRFREERDAARAEADEQREAKEAAYQRLYRQEAELARLRAPLAEDEGMVRVAAQALLDYECGYQGIPPRQLDAIIGEDKYVSNARAALRAVDERRKVGG